MQSAAKRFSIRAIVGLLGGISCALSHGQVQGGTMRDKAEGRTFRYGLCVHQAADSGTATFDALLKRIDELGVDVVRRDFDWGRIQAVEGRWDFSSDDKTVDEFRGIGVDVQGVIAYTARWASTGDRNSKDWLDWARAAPRIDAYADFSAGLVAHYTGRVHLWEIWNEPDIEFWRGTSAQYVELFDAAGKAMHRVDPKVTILNGGFAWNRSERNPNLVAEVGASASRANWNVWAFHDYMTFAQMISRTQTNQQAYDVAKLDIPIWVNEGGFHTLNAGGEAEQAITLAKKLAAAPSLGLSGYFWYDLLDDGTDPHEPEHHFGLLRSDLSPKPAFFAYKTLVRQIADRTFERRFELKEDTSLWGMQYRGKAGQDNVLVLWREGKGRETPLWIGGKTGSVIGETSDLMGVGLSSATLGNGRLVNISDAPIYIHYSGANPLTARSVLMLPDKVPLIRNEASAFEIGIVNPSDAPLELALELGSTDEQVAFTPSKQTVAVPPNGSAKSTVSARLATQKDRASGRILLTVKGASQSVFSAQFPFEAATPIAKLKTPAKLATITTGEGSFVSARSQEDWVSLFEGIPRPEMQWHGERDSGLAVRLAYDDKALFLNIEVEDDFHKQAFELGDLWKGDSVQCAVSVDDSQAGYLAFGLGLNETSGTTAWVDSVPPNGTLAPGGWDDTLGREITRQGTVTHYNVRVPWVTLGLNERPRHGLRLNVIANDDDGNGRKGWMQLSDGIGKVKNASLFRMFACE